MGAWGLQPNNEMTREKHHSGTVVGAVEGGGGLKPKYMCWLVLPGVRTGLGCQEGLSFICVPHATTVTPYRNSILQLYTAAV